MRGLPARRSALALCLLLASWRPAGGQLLYDAPEEYDNYARIGYRPYTAGVFGRTTRNVYDELGNFVMDGVEVFQLDESRTDAPNPGSYINKGYFYGAYLNRLVVAQDSYKNWASQLIVGDRIRTKFSSLTLDMVALNGTRWDIDLDGSQFTFVGSRQDWPIFTDADNAQHSAQDWATYLLGGHFHRRLGALDMSLSYVNQSRTNSLVSWGDNSLKGVLPNTNNPPAFVVVKVSDDSDRDGGGPRVFDLRVDELVLEVAGSSVKVDTDADTAQVWASLLRPEVTRHDSRVIDSTYPNRDQYFPEERSVPPYFQYLKGQLPLVQDAALKANGTEYLLFWFRVPQDLRGQVEQIRFVADVANDYRIEVAEIYLPGGVAPSANPDVTGERATYFSTVAAAPGNVQDMSNRRQVRFAYGRQTGRTNVSLRLEVERQGFELRTEYARSLLYEQYPTTGANDRWQRSTGGAFFVNLKKRLGWTSVGGELFRLSPRYSTVLSVEDPNFRSYTDMLESPFSVFPNFTLRYNNTVEFSTVDDNDDRDRYPDTFFLNEFADSDGIYPGLDMDQDGRPDTNENSNTTPDYLEPFLLYGSDPPEYDYGDDLNNNGVIDHREDDLKPDYPYEVDRKGYHLFGEAEPLSGLRLSLGHYDTREIWRGGRNWVRYAKLNCQRSLHPYGAIEVANAFKVVHDDIPDDTPQYSYLVSNAIPFDVRSTTSAAMERFLVEDQLAMRNSLVNTAYVHATLFRIRDLTLDNRLKSTLNWQRATGAQPANLVREWAWVLRGDYRWRLGKLLVEPKAKLMAYARTDREDLVRRVREGFFFPMVIVRYALTPMTDLGLGAQGLPFLKSQYRDFENDHVRFSLQDYMATVTNSTTYNGYHLSLNLGYQVKLIRYADRQRAGEDVDRALFFIRLIMGLEPFKG
jgi:hypothetical protein